jgi:hypothetical protein
MRYALSRLAQVPCRCRDSRQNFGIVYHTKGLRSTGEWGMKQPYNHGPRFRVVGQIPVALIVVWQFAHNPDLAGVTRLPQFGSGESWLPGTNQPRFRKDVLPVACNVPWY